ncbi:SRPBCC family protein [Conexibacter woesei]|uniref:SRPBCC family protein n=1 Tax=Conexibacter woesei TaxID=191495 RepID=UPI0004034D48|nr:SRPBCC family protein [Conexibacter woesei]
MATNVATISAPVDQVFAVLSDPGSYAYWVVGSDSIRDADASWPAVGAKLHHRIGTGPFKLNDNTEVLEVTAPVHLVLQARARPFGTARVTLDLVAHGDHTEVTMGEGPGDAISRVVFNPLADRILHRRNDEALRRLGELARRRDAVAG